MRGRPLSHEVSLAIKEATLHQIRTRGFAGLSVESIAAEAGISKATIYRRYKDKSDLVTSAIADDLAPDDSLESSDPKGDLIRALCAFDQRITEPCLEVIGGLLGMRQSGEAMELHRTRVVRPRFDSLLRLLDNAKFLGQLDADADLELALEMLVGSIFARRIAGVQARPGWAKRAVNLVWEGMAPKP